MLQYRNYTYMFVSANRRNNEVRAHIALKYGKLDTKYPSIYRYFLRCIAKFYKPQRRAGRVVDAWCDQLATFVGQTKLTTLAWEGHRAGAGDVELPASCFRLLVVTTVALAGWSLLCCAIWFIEQLFYTGLRNNSDAHLLTACNASWRQDGRPIIIHRVWESLACS